MDNPRASGSVEAPPFLLGLFLVTSASMAAEVLVTRLLSVVTWYSLAFLVLAMGMFGLTVGAVRVYLRSEEYVSERLASSLSRDALAFSVLLPLSYILLLLIPLRVEPVWTTPLLFVVFAAIVALPFVPAGQVVAAAVTKAPFPTGRVYAVDLAGAALGAPLVPELLERTNLGTAILLISALAAMGALAFARSGEEEGGERWGLRGAVILLLLAGLNHHAGHRGLVTLWAKGRAEERSQVEVETWNSHSRVQVSKVSRGAASLWGAGSKCKIPQVRQRMILIDADAATPLYQLEKGLEDLAFLDCDVTNIVHQLRPGGAMAIIGVGGSRDLQAALRHGHDPVVGIELNRRLLEVLKGPLGQPTGIPGHPAVRLVHDEARSYLSRTNQQFRVIQASLIDTWAATGAGAHALGENGLYTVEAWRTFLDRLEEGGVVTMSRWASGETVRLVAMAMQALLERGVARPRDHMALVQGGPVTTLVVGKQPLTEEDGRRLRETAEAKGFRVIFAPGTPLGPDKMNEVLGAATIEELHRATLLPELDYRPSTDDRPFFFNVVRLRAFARVINPQAGGTIEGNRMATTTLVLSLLSSLLLAVVAIVLPLWRKARPAGRVGLALGAGLLYFAMIGVGFMLCEVGLLQRLSLVLGHPTYSLIVVLASLVAAAGVGSLLSDRLPLGTAPGCYLLPVVLMIVLLGVGWGLPALAPTVQSLPLRSRISFAVAFTASLGLLLGMAFPTGMRLVRATSEEETPWLWGINGVGGVIASSSAVMIALEFGLRTLFFVSAFCYAALLPAVFVLRREATAR
ncbi:MAG: hypothetical protein RMJ98_02680 [Myxococcales bacterium]|nr:hypothetical protein [Polyangiaceae bacterium]MDW8248195.1 hypothetical protein [Myxococcales bacterium]